MNEAVLDTGCQRDAGPAEEGGGDERADWKQSTRDTCTRLVKVIMTPWTECQHRTHPRIVPDYSMLVLVSCVTNPLFGSAACFLHCKAKDMFHKGHKREADVVYLAVFILCTLSIATPVLLLSVLVPYVTIQPNQPPTRRPCIIDTEKRLAMNMTEYKYCYWLHYVYNAPGYSNRTRVIDLSHRG